MHVRTRPGSWSVADLLAIVLIASLSAFCGAARADSPGTYGPLTAISAEPEQDLDSVTGFDAPRLEQSAPLGDAPALRPRLPSIELNHPAGADPFADALESDPDLYGGWSEARGLTIPAEFQGVTSRWLPSGLLFYSYLAGEKEPRFALQTLYANGHGMYWEIALGGRVGLYRWGTPGAIGAEGWQLDIEGAPLLRLDLGSYQDLVAVDYRFGVPLTWRKGPWSAKFGYYHISSHLGDENLLKHPGIYRRNYYRESLVLGISYDVTPAWRVYGEFGVAPLLDGGAKPMEVQFGTEYSPQALSAPFFAVNGHLRQEFLFGGSVNAEVGWQIRGEESGHRFRVGLQVFDGPSMQYSLFDKHETLYGAGVWLDY